MALTNYIYSRYYEGTLSLQNETLSSSSACTNSDGCSGEKPKKGHMQKTLEWSYCETIKYVCKNGVYQGKVTNTDAADCQAAGVSPPSGTNCLRHWLVI